MSVVALTPEEAIFHSHMHRMYRLVRGSVAREVSPLDPRFPELVRQAFREQSRVAWPRLSRNGRHA